MRGVYFTEVLAHKMWQCIDKNAKFLHLVIYKEIPHITEYKSLTVAYGPHDALYVNWKYYYIIMPLSLDSVGDGIMISGCPSAVSVRPFFCPVRSGYHDVS